MKKIFIIFVIILTGCTDSWHMRQAIKKNPDIIRNDTVVTVDTVFKAVEVPKVVERTVFVNDTIVITKYDSVTRDSVRLKIIKEPGDTIRAEMDCPDCPEINKDTTATQTILVGPTIWERLKDASLLVGLLVLVVIIIRIVKQFI